MKSVLRRDCRLVSVLALLFFLPFYSTTRAEPSIQAPEKVSSGSMFIVRTEGLDKDAKFVWHSPSQNVILADLLTREGLSPVLLVQPSEDGLIYLVLAWIEGDGPPQMKSVAVLVGKAQPVPDPDPDPDPNPDPDPDPTPQPSPMRVLFLREAQAPAPQSLMSTQIREYLNTHTLKSDGKPEWRVWDDDYVQNNLVFISDLWKQIYAEALRRSNGVRPWVVLSNGTTGFSGPLPDNTDEVLALLKKYGGE